MASYKKNQGLTLIEILVVIGIFTLVISFGSVVDFSVFRGDTFLTEQSTIVAVLEKARSRAMANMFESQHGVCYRAPDYVIFEGDTCTSSGSELIPANQNIATISDFSNPAKFPTIVFSQLTGRLEPQLTPIDEEIKITIQDGIKSADIKINNEGRINW